jgi:hypothetical protein
MTKRIKKFNQALLDGNWYSHSKSTKYFGDIAIGIGLLAGAGAVVYSTSTQAGIANQQLGLADTQADKQNTSFQQLEQLLANPGGFFSSPTFQQSEYQGAQAIARTNAAQSGPNSGNEATALQTFGQGFAQQQLLSQENLLAGMSGTGFNPASAGSVASGAASAATGGMNSLAGLLAFFGNSGGGSSTNVTFDPSAALGDWNAANAPVLGGLDG